MAILLILFGVGALPVLIGSILSTLRRVNIIGATTFLLLGLIVAFGPTEPHPYIPMMAMVALFFLILGWMVAYVVTLWKKPKLDIK